jgi:uncharacterized protein (DUF433 family)
MDAKERISINPEIRFGKLCVRGTRITVGDVLFYLASGMSEDAILSDFPQLTREDTCLALPPSANAGSQSVQLAEKSPRLLCTRIWRRTWLGRQAPSPFPVRGLG